MNEALEDDIHVAGGTHVIDSSNTTCTAWNIDCVCGDESGIVPRGIREELLDLSFPSCLNIVSTESYPTKQ
jgi:hypothetical protein